MLTPRVYRAFLDDEASIGEDDCSFTVSNAEIPAYSQFTMAILIGDEIFTLLKETEEFKLFVVENEVSYRAVQGFKSGEVGLYLRCK